MADLSKLGLARVRGRLRRLIGKQRPVAQTPINLAGDRDVEWAWVAARMSAGAGRALDFGNGGSHLSLIAALKGFDVVAVDLGACAWDHVHPRVRFLQGDLFDLPLESASFDLVINCSTVEHVGLKGRYGVNVPEEDGDLRAMRRLHDLMRPNGTMLLTVPVGLDTVFAPLCRVYGERRLPLLLQDFSVVEEQYWVKDEVNRWVQRQRSEALDFRASVESQNAFENVYALGCFELQRGG